MADNYTALKSSQKKRYISKETFNSLDLSQIPVGSEYEVISPIEKGDLSADINNALNKAEKSIPEPTNQTTGSDGDVLVKKGGGSEWKSMPVPGVVQGTGQSTTEVMSQKATTDSLNLLEAKLNENIVKDPSKTYIVWKGNNFPNSANATFKAPAGCVIDWGDGNVETFDTTSTTVNQHTYSDGIDYHLIAISGLTITDSSAFRDCSGLTSVTIGNSVTSIGRSAFDGCSGLTSVTIPDSVTSIDWSAFDGCSGLTSITIPDSVTTIRLGAFYGCSGLKSITLKSTTPPTLGSDAIPTTIEKIIVPKSAINAYKAATGWSTYASKIVYEVDSSDLPDTSKFAKLDGDNEFKGMIIFDQPIWLYGNKPTIKDVDNNTFYLPAKPYDPGWTYTLATTADVDAKSSFSVEVW